MNERIKELIKQAADQTSAAFSSSNFRQSEWESDFREKFAELIVKECSKLADKLDNDVTTLWDKDGFPLTIGDQIKKHFGVE